jgi:hypothetical protein
VVSGFWFLGLDSGGHRQKHHGSGNGEKSQGRALNGDNNHSNNGAKGGKDEDGFNDSHFFVWLRQASVPADGCTMIPRVRDSRGKCKYFCTLPEYIATGAPGPHDFRSCFPAVILKRSPPW